MEEVHQCPYVKWKEISYKQILILRYTRSCACAHSHELDSSFMQMLILPYLKVNLSAQSNYSALTAWARAQPAGEPDKQTS